MPSTAVMTEEAPEQPRRPPEQPRRPPELASADESDSSKVDFGFTTKSVKEDNKQLLICYSVVVSAIKSILH